MWYRCVKLASELNVDISLESANLKIQKTNLIADFRTIDNNNIMYGSNERNHVITISIIILLKIISVVYASQCV